MTRFLRLTLLMTLFSEQIYGQTNVVASFTAADTVCLNDPVQITNTSTGATNFYWSFCAADFNNTPQADNLGDPGNLLNTPVFMDYALDNNGRYYGFVVNYATGNLIRLDYGKSLLNPPTAKDFGTFGGKIPPNAEGVQLKEENGKCYIFVVSGGNSTGSASVLVRIEFGSSFSNNSPSAVNLGNIGGLSFPHDLYIFREGNNNYYGFTVNINNNSLTRLDFGSSLSNVPSGTNLGNIGNMSYPCGFSFVNSNGNWYSFITNRNSNSITRLTFGKSLANIPTGSNMGNPGNFLDKPRDVSIFQSCQGIVGLVVNEENEQTGSITKLNFGGNLLSNPSAKSLGNLGNLKFPHSISKFFLQQNDVYAFITNVANNTITRLRYKGCTNSNIATSTQQNPPFVTYNQPGTYHINLLVDIGLPTETSFCRQITVLPPPAFSLTNDTSTCTGDSVQLQAVGVGLQTYQWSPPNGLSNTGIKDPLASPGGTTKYYVTVTDSHGCKNVDSVIVAVQGATSFDINPKTIAICSGDSTVLSASGGDIYKWSPAETVTKPNSAITTVFPDSKTTYQVAITSTKCNFRDTLFSTVDINPLPVVTISKSNDINCNNPEAQLNATGGISYNWSPSTYINDTQIPDPIVTPLQDTWYFVVASGSNGCTSKDSVLVKSSLESGGGNFYIPNAFTPNGDRVNDCFGVRYWRGADQFEMSIYNRWGQLIYHSRNINDCWDGTIKGIKQASGTYVYQISVSSVCTHGTIHRNGTVVLMQ